MHPAYPFFLLIIAAGIGQSLLCVQLLPHGARCPLHWYGKGSTTAERQAAINYAQHLLKGRESVELTVLEEGSADEMFWLMLGEGGYALADY